MRVRLIFITEKMHYDDIIVLHRKLFFLLTADNTCLTETVLLSI